MRWPYIQKQYHFFASILQIKKSEDQRGQYLRSHSNSVEKGNQELSSYILWFEHGKFLWVTITMASGIHIYSAVTRKNASHHEHGILHSLDFQQTFIEHLLCTGPGEQDGPHP